MKTVKSKDIKILWGTGELTLLRAKGECRKSVEEQGPEEKIEEVNEWYK